MENNNNNKKKKKEERNFCIKKMTPFHKKIVYSYNFK